MAKKRLKRNRPVGLDRISQLPDPILYHILSYVPTLSVVRMSVLSRRWRRVWYSVPTLQFSDVGYRRRSPVFEAFVGNCMKHRERAARYVADADVTRLKLDFHYDSKKPAGLKNWLSSPIVRNGVTDLDVCAEKERFAWYCSEPTIVASGKSLVSVKLKGVKWDDSFPVNLPSLRSLCLTSVSIRGEAIHNLVAQCPSLEECHLKSMYNISDLRISSPSLKLLGAKGGFKSVTVEAASLRSLSIESYKACVDFSACTQISDLSLDNACFKGSRSFDDQISKLALLENLSLTIMSHEHIKISNLNLKTLSVTKNYNYDLSIVTDTPNLVSFRYYGTVELSMLMDAPNRQLDGLFVISKVYGEQCYRDWYYRMKTFLSNINFPWNNICVHVHDPKELIVPKAMRSRLSPLPDLKHMKIVSHVELTRESELRNALRWISPSLETLSIEKGGICKCRNWITYKKLHEEMEEARKLRIRRSPRRVLPGPAPPQAH